MSEKPFNLLLLHLLLILLFDLFFFFFLELETHRTQSFFLNSANLQSYFDLGTRVGARRFGKITIQLRKCELSFCELLHAKGIIQSAN